jgi:hypothetical protein
MGGTAVVIANDEDEALRLVERDDGTRNFWGEEEPKGGRRNKPEVIGSVELTKPVVVHNDNGDY